MNTTIDRPLTPFERALRSAPHTPNLNKRVDRDRMLRNAVEHKRIVLDGTALREQQVDCAHHGHRWEPSVFSFATIYTCALGCGAELGDGLTSVPHTTLVRTSRGREFL